MEEKQERVDKVEEHIKKDFFFKKNGQVAYGVVFKETELRQKKLWL